jgi:hypothetical protein
MALPKMFYRSDGTTTIVTTQAQQDALSGAWFDSPADYGLITAPSVAQATTGTAAATSYAPNARQQAHEGSP